MKIESISNQKTFGSKITYTQTIQKGFEYARQNADENSKEVQNFIKNLKTILNDKKQDSVRFSTTPCIALFREGKSKKEFVLANHPFTSDAEGLLCLEGINRYVSKLTEPVKSINNNIGKRKLDVNAIKRELDALEEQIKKSN